MYFFLQIKVTMVNMKFHLYFIHYRLPIKLWEDNVVSCVCLSVIVSTVRPMWPLPMMHWTSPCRDPQPYPHPTQPSGHGTSLYRNPLSPGPGPALSRHGTHCTETPDPSPHYWHLVATTGDLFKLVCLNTPTAADNWWPRLHTHSNLFTYGDLPPPTGANI